MARMPLSNPGCVVTSLTRSPCSQTSRFCSRKPLMYCCPVRAGIAALLTYEFGKRHERIPAQNLVRAFKAEFTEEQEPRATDLMRARVRVPRARETSEIHEVCSAHLLLAGPLLARQLV